eukprot:Nk52_evm25s358 gene=Nk52_evmTU25s358
MIDSRTGSFNGRAGGRDELYITQLIKKFRDGVFGVLFVMAKDTSLPKEFVIMGMIIDFCQLLSFSMTNVFPWNTTLTSALSTILLFIRFEWYLEGSAISVMLIFYTCLFMVTGLLVIAAYVGYEFSEKNFKNLWTLKVLRSVAGLFVTVLYIPILTVFIAMLDCSEQDDNLFDCFDMWHMINIIASVVISILFMALSLLVAATFYEDDPLGDAGLARPHARLDAFYLFMKTLITIMFTLFEKNSQDKSLVQWCLIGLLVFVGLSVTYLNIMYLPYYNFGYCQLRAALMTIFTWSTFCLVITKIINDEDNSTGALMFYIGAPLLGIAASLLCSKRRLQIVRYPKSKLGSPYEVEMKARFFFEDVINSVMKSREESAGAAIDTVNIDSKTSEFALIINEFGYEDKIDKNSTIKSLKAGREERINMISIDNLKAVERLYQEASTVFSVSASLHLFWAKLYLIYFQDIGKTVEHLSLAETKSPSFDEEFTIFRQRQMLQDKVKREDSINNSEDGKINGESSGDIISFIAFQKHMEDSRKYSRRCAMHYMELWSEVLADTPDLHAIHTLAGKITVALELANSHYQKVLRLSPQNESLLFEYAEFLSSAAQDTKKSESFRKKAVEIKEVKERKNGENSESALGNFLIEDKNAVFVINGKPLEEGDPKLGTIEEVNFTASNLLKAYVPSNFASVNFFETILPYPFNVMYIRDIHNWSKTGTAELFNTVQRVFVQTLATRNLIPVELIMLPNNFRQGKPFSFLVVLRERLVKQYFMLVDQKTRAVLAISQCRELLGRDTKDVVVDADDVKTMRETNKAPKISIDDLIPEVYKNTSVFETAQGHIADIFQINQSSGVPEAKKYVVHLATVDAYDESVDILTIDPIQAKSSFLIQKKGKARRGSIAPTGAAYEANLVVDAAEQESLTREIIKFSEKNSLGHEEESVEMKVDVDTLLRIIMQNADFYNISKPPQNVTKSQQKDIKKRKRRKSVLEKQSMVNLTPAGDSLSDISIALEERSQTKAISVMLELENANNEGLNVPQEGKAKISVSPRSQRRFFMNKNAQQVIEEDQPATSISKSSVHGSTSVFSNRSIDTSSDNENISPESSKSSAATAAVGSTLSSSKTMSTRQVFEPVFLKPIGSSQLDPPSPGISGGLETPRYLNEELTDVEVTLNSSKARFKQQHSDEQKHGNEQLKIEFHSSLEDLIVKPYSTALPNETNEKSCSVIYTSLGERMAEIMADKRWRYILSPLKVSVYFSMVMFLCLAITLTVLYNVYSTNIKNDIGSINLVGNVQETCNVLADLVRSLSLVAEGSTLATSGAVLLSELKSTVSLLHSLFIQLEGSIGDMPEIARDQYMNGLISITNINVQGISTSENIVTRQAIIDTISYGKQVSEMPVADILIYKRQVYWLVVNIHGSIQSGLTNFREKYGDDMNEQADDLKNVMMIVCFAGMSLAAVLFFCVLIPVVRRMNAKRYELIYIFLQLPKTVVAHLKLAALIRADAIEKDPLVNERSFRENVKLFGSEEYSVDEEGKRIFTPKKGGRQLLKTYITFSLVFLIAAIFFIYAYLVTDKAVSANSHSSAEIILLAQQRRILVSSIMFSTREYGLQSSVTSVNEGDAQSLIDQLQNLEESVTYGSSALGLSVDNAFDARNPSNDDILFKDGCLFEAVFNPSLQTLSAAISTCATFQSKITNGLYPGLIEYRQAMQDVISQFSLRSSSLSSAQYAATTVNNSLLAQEEQFEYPTLQNSCLSSALFYRDETENVINNSGLLLLIGLFMLIALYVLLCLALYIPLFSLLQSEVNRTLMLYPHVLQRNTQEPLEFAYPAGYQNSFNH